MYDRETEKARKKALRTGMFILCRVGLRIAPLITIKTMLDMFAFDVIARFFPKWAEKRSIKFFAKHPLQFKLAVMDLKKRREKEAAKLIKLSELKEAS